MIQVSHANDRAQVVFNAIKKRHRMIRRAEILTGYLGPGARQQLEGLGIGSARIVLGLKSPHAEVSESLYRAISGLSRGGFAEVRICRGLHAKLYIFDKKIAMFGSANLSRAGWETLREFVCWVDDQVVVNAASKFFCEIWEKHSALADVVRGTGPNGPIRNSDPTTVALGTAFAPLSHTKPRNTQNAARRNAEASSQPRVARDDSAPRVRILANSAYQLIRNPSIQRMHSTYWSAPMSTRKGDILAMCFSKTVTNLPVEYRSDERIDAVHSIWQAAGKWRQFPKSQWQNQHLFVSPVRLKKPVKCNLLFKKGVLNSSRWPQGSAGKLLRTRAEILRFARVLAAENPNQRAAISRALGL